MAQPQVVVAVTNTNPQVFVSVVEFRVADNVAVTLGSDSDVQILLRPTTIAADAEVTDLIEGTSNHQGVAADSLVMSNLTNDGDIIMLVSDGGNSVEALRVEGASSTLDLGFGMLISKLMAASTTRIEVNGTGIGFFATAPVARPTGVAVSSAGIHAALVTLGLITA